MTGLVATAEERAREMVASDHSETNSLEKAGDDHIERLTYHPSLSNEDAEWLASIPSKEQSRIYHKVDRRLVPMLALLYLIAHIDRANIGNAKIEGLEASLNMQDTDYNTALIVFFIPYILCEIPSNMILAKFNKPSTYMGMLVVCWGVVMTFTGVVQNFGGLVATRFLLGAFEAGFFPGAMWIVSQWYPPNKTQSRMAFFYMSSALSGAFSGLLAAAIAEMDGIGGYEGWRWIFIVEGIVSVLVGVFCFFGLPDSPTLAKWLKPDEARFLELIHVSTRGARVSKESKRFSWSVLWSCLTDWQLYLQILVYWSNCVPNYGLKFTMPQILSNMGFESTQAQLLTAPPYACGAISAVLSGYFADRLTWRMPFIVASQSCLVIGFGILYNKAAAIENNVALCYFCIFLCCIGLYPIIPGCNAWTINNLAAAEKRAVGIGFLISVGNAGGLPGSFIFLERESPMYPTGFGSCLSFGAAGLVAALALEFFYWRHNKKYENLTKEEAIAKHGEAKLLKMGNKSPLFKYGY